MAFPPSKLDRIEYPEIKTSSGTLRREIEGSDGVICSGCDGTSKEVRACLASLNCQMPHWVVQSDADKTNAASHQRLVTACAFDAMQRLNLMARKSFDRSHPQQ